MRNLVGMLAATLVILIAIPSTSLCDDPQPKKYGVELQLGGGYSLMQDVNDFVAHARFTGLTPDKEVNIGAQFGVGILYRQQDNFGWQFGYNRFAFIQNYRVSAYFTAEESWAEQSVKGSEYYALATWFKPMGSAEMFFGIGPGMYTSSMDRSIDVVVNPGSHITDGGFADAEGKSVGIIGVIGYEMMFGENTALALQVGARAAQVGKLEYTDQVGNDQIVYQDPYLTGVSADANFAKLAVDYTGVFLKVSLRSYFEPSSSWRTPKR